MCMHNGKYCSGWSHGCIFRKIRKVLLLVGGFNWGLVGVGMLMGSDLNVVHMLLGAWPVVEGVVYVLVGLAAVFKLIGCRCHKCMTECEACVSGSMEGKM